MGWTLRRVWRAGGALASIALPAGAVASEPPPINARAYILVNPATGEVLAQKNAGLRLPMASTTKIMTALVVLERAELAEQVVVPKNATSPGGSTASLVPGERLTVRDLLTGLMVGSGNDASIALANHVGKGSEGRFVGYMNEKAATFGLTNTRFANPHGLDANGHYSTVSDLLTLGQRAYGVPIIRQVVANRTATIPGPKGVGTRTLESENDLLSIDPEADGIKTGHTNGAGYSLVAHAKRKSNGVDLYLALIGSPSRTQRAAEAKRLFDWGLAQYARVAPVTTHQTIVRVAVRDRPGVTVALRPEKPLAATVKLGAAMSRTVVAPVELIGTHSAGAPMGTLTLLVDGKPSGTTKLVTAQPVDAPSIVERVRSGIGRLV